MLRSPSEIAAAAADDDGNAGTGAAAAPGTAAAAGSAASEEASRRPAARRGRSARTVGRTGSRAKKLLELLHADICGPITPCTLAGNKYFLLIVDDFIRWMWVFVLSTKNDAFQAFKKFKFWIENKTEHKIRTLQTDWDDEFLSTEFIRFCANKDENLPEFMVVDAFDTEGVIVAANVEAGAEHVTPPATAIVPMPRALSPSTPPSNAHAVTSPPGPQEIGIFGYSNSDLADNLDGRKNTSGMTFYFNESLVPWNSQKHKTVALSSCDAKFMVATTAAYHALWLRSLASELTSVEQKSVTLFVDNKSAIALIKNLVFYGYSKHIDARFRFIRECIEKGQIMVEFWQTDDLALLPSPVHMCERLFFILAVGHRRGVTSAMQTPADEC
ncbi:hypothetical protein ZIOFF_034175 [Zingiber officinale]|uniref:Integrase catalytic domain-containing protein n=1 Tax=Zingiber officinale TaxID=94328 RepID=A0A8J5H3C6_ZINOF|nr:hypothetical protein ZIOFF_034175 [Zingiber officinale]